MSSYFFFILLYFDFIRFCLYWIEFSFFILFSSFSFGEGVRSFHLRVLRLVFFEEFLYIRNKTFRERQSEGDGRRFLERRSEEGRGPEKKLLKGGHCGVLISQSHWIVKAFISWLQPAKQKEGGGGVSSPLPW